MASSHSSGDTSGFQQMSEPQDNLFSTGSQADDRDGFSEHILQACEDPGAPSVVGEEPEDPVSPEEVHQGAQLMNPKPKFKSRPKINFRARWESQSKSRRDDMSILDELISQSAGSDGSWELYQSQDKKRRLVPPDFSEHAVEDTAQVEDVANVARMAAMQQLRQHDLKMPWEKGPLAPVFASEQTGSLWTSALTMTRIGLADTLAPMASIKQDTPMPSGSISQFARKRIASARVVLNDDELLAKCLNQVKVLLLLDLSGTEVGITLCNLAGGLDETVDILQILKDCFSRKATATILKRTSAFRNLADWVMREGLGSIWSLTEAQLYAYMCHLRESGAAASRASHALEALNFFQSTLRFKKMDIQNLMSSRVTGAAHAMYMNKRKLVQAPLLTVEAVIALEQACVSEANLLQTVVTGALLFCVFASARWADFVRIETLSVEEFQDVTLIEGATSKHKTAKSKEAKTRLLPYLALGRFSQARSWGLVFLDAWNKVRDSTGQNFLPAWNDRSGTWASGPMTTAQASMFLKEYLEPYIGTEEAERFSSHSCKPTLLTWAGMTDILTREERTLMGHHIEASTRSATTYNRDALLIVHSKLMQVLNLIKSGELKPDASRAEKLSMLIGGAVQEDAESVESDYEETDPRDFAAEALQRERPGLPQGT